MRNHHLTESLLYRIPLKDTMRMILNFYWDAPKKVLDVTAGERKIWGRDWYNHETLDGKPARWQVDFNDLSLDAKAEYHYDCRWMTGIPDDSYDIIVFDPPFTNPKNDSCNPDHNGLYFRNKFKPGFTSRLFYMRNFIEPQILFQYTKNEFRRIAREGLVIKISDRHEDRRLVPQHVHAIQEYGSMFDLVDIIHYRGNRPVMGAKLPFVANTISYYLIFKKNRFRR
jgi:hypothetical protein